MLMTNRVGGLLQHYSQLESQYHLIDCSDQYKTLVTATTNHDYPVQRWFHLKEAYSIDLLENLVDDWRIDPRSIRRVLDPFCGIGTTLLSVEKIAKKWGLDDLSIVGIERNPFFKFVTETKLGWNRFDRERITAKAEYLLNGASRPKPDVLPALSTLHRTDVYALDVLNELLGFKNAIMAIESAERAPLLLGYSSTLEDLSGIRKDGRALRIVPNKRCPQVSQALRLAWSTISEDIEQAQGFFKPIHADVYDGDGRKLETDSAVSQTKLSNFDLIMYSPPYLNNIDYTEVYKLELWLCGFVSSYDEFRSLRLQTFRSHPSVSFSDPVTSQSDERLNDINNTIDILVNTLPADKYRNQRIRLFTGYFDDMYQTLKYQKDALSNGGWIFCVVGNSLHGSSKEPEIRVPVASDLLITSIAHAIGFEVKAIQVARHLKRRSPETKFLRESIIVMRKPENGYTR
jgi:DNA modification methylase